MTKAELTRRIKEEARSLGFDLVGVARVELVAEGSRLREWLHRGFQGSMTWMDGHLDKRIDPRELVPGCRSIVSVGIVYRHPPAEAPQPKGTELAVYAWGEDYHRVIKDKLRQLLDRGGLLDPTFRGRCFVDSAPLMEKYWAERAGVGWRGKNTNLINKRKGSFLFLGEVVVEADLVPDDPGTDHCGTCTACLEACPTGALVEPYLLDSRRCISYWTIEHRGDLEPEEEEGIGEWLFGCDICQDVCPWNEGGPVATEARFETRSESWPGTLDDLLALDAEAFRRRFGDTAVERTRRKGLVRNAAIVAGNTGLASRMALEKAAADEDPVVAGAARRALARRPPTDSAFTS